MTWINPFVTGDVVSDVVIVPGIGVIVSGKFNLQGRSGVVMLGETGNVLPDIPARPLFYQDGSLENSALVPATLIAYMNLRRGLWEI